MDPLVHVFAGMQVESRVPARMEARGSWAVRFAHMPFVRFGTVLKGRCWVHSEGADRPAEIVEGDGYILPRGLPYRIYSDASRVPDDGSLMFRDNTASTVRLGFGEGEETVIVSGRFTSSEITTQILLDALPAFVRISRASERDASLLQACTQILLHETQDSRFGSHLMRHHVAQMMLVHALRSDVEDAGERPGSWLRAMTDPKIGPAVKWLHAEPARHWTVEELARESCMSRSMFAQRFKAVAGMPPLEYLLHLRIRLAAHQLTRRGRTISAIAYELGYQSVSAFSASFRRVTNMSPKDYRAAH